MNALPAPVYSAAQVRAMDAYAIQQLGIPGYTLMTRAGEAALDLLCDRWPAATRILVLCGAGNNGGDGYVVARLARAAGLEVTVAALLPPTVLRGDALRAWQDYAAAGGEVVGFAASLPEAADVVVDALLGTGLDRPVSGAFAECIRAVSRAGRPVLAIDVPSGLGADTGQVMGIALGASVTITFVGLKAGLFLGAGPDLAGELAFASLGAGDSAPVGDPLMTRLGPSVLAAALPPRRRTAHKGEHGRVLVVGGGPGMPGAARLAAEAALRAGAGLVTVAAWPGNVTAVVGSRPEIICHGIDAPSDLDPLLEAADVLAVGPGLGQGDWSRALFEASCAAGKPMIVDADALNLLAASPRRADNWVLTPHPGEAGRLLGRDAAAIQSDRLGTVRELRSHFGGVAVLKGACSLVLGPSTRTYVCDAGNPGMAVAGMGDVLTGTVAGIAGQCRDLELAATAGVLAHAQAGDLAARRGQRGLLAGDVIDSLPACVNPS